MPLHVLGHVEADQFDTHNPSELPGDLGLADTGRASEQEIADGLLFAAQASARHFDGVGQHVDGLVLTEYHQLQIPLQVAQYVLIRGRHGLGRDASDLGDDRFDIPDIDHLPALGGR